MNSMESFFVALNTVMPFLIYIAFGYGVRRSGLVDEAFMKKLNKLIFRAFFPIMMFNNFYKMDSGISFNPTLIAAAVLSLFLLILLLLLVVPRMVKGNPQRGVIIQAIYRSNFVLFGIPLATHLFGDAGTLTASMLVAIVVPLYNVTAVIILELFHTKKIAPLTLVRNVFTNPLILGSVVGLFFYLLKIKLPSPLEETVTQFASLTTPLALFVLGGTMHFSEIHTNLKYVVPSMLAKLVFVPGIILVVATILGFTNVERFVYFEMFAAPVATASYAMAQNMGGDGELAAQFVVLSTVASVVTLFFWIFFMNSIGFI